VKRWTRNPKQESVYYRRLEAYTFMYNYFMYNYVMYNYFMYNYFMYN